MNDDKIEEIKTRAYGNYYEMVRSTGAGFKTNNK